MFPREPSFGGLSLRQLLSSSATACICCFPVLGSTKLRTTLLDKEHARIKTAQETALKDCENITVAVDGWSNLRKESVYACNAITPSRDMHLVAFDEVSVHVHDIMFLKGKVLLAPLVVGRAGVALSYPTDTSSKRHVRLSQSTATACVQ